MRGLAYAIGIAVLGMLLVNFAAQPQYAQVPQDCPDGRCPLRLPLPRVQMPQPQIVEIQSVPMPSAPVESQPVFVQGPVLVRGQPVRNLVRCRPLQRVAAARPVRSVLRRLFCR